MFSLHPYTLQKQYRRFCAFPLFVRIHIQKLYRRFLRFFNFVRTLFKSNTDDSASFPFSSVFISQNHTDDFYVFLISSVHSTKAIQTILRFSPFRPYSHPKIIQTISTFFYFVRTRKNAPCQNASHHDFLSLNPGPS